jgi:eukaryotic-like serine/threonine-protein kinase
MSARDTKQTDPMVGRRLASYEILSRVAAGGMGVVYRARHVYIDKIVALKVLDEQLSARPELIERFRTEAQSLARVEHENVVKVIDILEDRGVHFIVMDFAEGMNLRTHVRRDGPMKGPELLSVARQTAEALLAAHRKGILHRDIKPENLIMDAKGRCKLADFGLAGDLRLIAEGHEGPLSFGTPAYSSPEVMRRQVPDRRSDIFSYGATLYFLATGKPPFGQSGVQHILANQRKGAAGLETLRHDLGHKFCRLVNECLLWHPQQRPAGFDAVLERLPRRIYVSAETPTEPTTEPTGLLTTEPLTGEQGNLARYMAIGGVVLGAAAILLIAGLWWLNRGTPPPQPPPDDTAHVPAPPEPDPAPVVPPAEPDPTEPEPPAPDPGRRADSDAFNEADLESRLAMTRAEYRRAWQAWSDFLEEFPESAFVTAAQSHRQAVVRRVAELRDSELRKAREASQEALDEDRTAEAMAAVDRFPPELLERLHEGDEISVAQHLASLRKQVQAHEGARLAGILEHADRLRADWEQARGDVSGWTEARRMRHAGNLLAERDLLEQFLPGRTSETQETVTSRLSRLRKLLESVHQEAETPVQEWRLYHDRLLGEWSEWLAAEADAVLARLRENGRHEDALRAIHGLREQIEERAAETRWHSPEVAARVREAPLLAAALQELEEEVRLAALLYDALESELRNLRVSGQIREYLIRDGERTRTIAGRVNNVGNREFSVAADGSLHTIAFENLTPTSVRRLLRTSDRPEHLVRLMAWLAARGEAADTEFELQRLERLSGTTPAHLHTARMYSERNRLGWDVRRRLTYLGARSGLRRAEDFTAEYGEELPESQILSMQALVAGDDADSANRYLALVRGVEDPEYIHLRTFADAIRHGNPTESDLRNRVALEPFSAEALTALAVHMRAQGRVDDARELAGRALLIDAGNETAYELWQE